MSHTIPTNNKVGGVLRRLPSLFDLGVIIYILMVCLWQDNYQRQLVFNFGALALLCLSIGLKPERKFHSLPLGLLLLWGMAGIFIHSWTDGGSMASHYLNVCLLSEGFIYLLSGILLIYLIVKYSRNYRYYYLTLPIIALTWFRSAIHSGRMTIVMAFFLSVIIYLLLQKRWKLALIPSVLGGIVTLLNWQWLCLKWDYRPYVFKALLQEIKSHPFIGWGFEIKSTLSGQMNMIWIKDPGHDGPIFRHNDYLSFAGYVGIIGAIFVLWFILSVFTKIKHKPIVILFLTLIITPMFQATMFNVYRASIFLMLMSLCILEGYVKEL